ncbi:MAG: hypothetical protein JSS78_07830 [Bacteroidetes bacterium]|nr:hypothetical protein [Bacteroidota bacterium]
MKKFLLAAMLPILFFSCAKEEVTNPLFRTPSCADTTDDGVFEAFTLPEKAQLLRYFKIIPDTQINFVMRYQNINGRVLYNRITDYNPFIRFRTNLPVKIFAWMPFSQNNEKYYSWVVNAPDTSMDYTVNIYQLRDQYPQLLNGCYRIYYAVSSSDTGIVYTKGHYDFEVRN